MTLLVDGSAFPWPTEGTPVVAQLLPDLYSVTATFYARSVVGVELQPMREPTCG